MSENKLCPIFVALQQSYHRHCIEDECGWWCEWNKSCAMVAIAAEVSDRLGEIRNTIAYK